MFLDNGVLAITGGTGEYAGTTGEMLLSAVGTDGKLTISPTELNNGERLRKRPYQPAALPKSHVGLKSAGSEILPERTRGLIIGAKGA